MDAPDGRRGQVRRRALGPLTLIACLWAGSPATAADLDDALGLLRAGKYEDCAHIAGEEIARIPWREPWHDLKARAEMARGDYPAAQATIENALRRFPASLNLRLLGHRAYRATGKLDDASACLDMIAGLVQAAPQRYNSPEGRVALGRFFLLRGADARKVLDQFYDVAIKQSPTTPDAYMASAELALDKQDAALAATTLGKAPKSAALDPDFHYLLARAYADGDRPRSIKELDEALKLNPRHVDGLLLRADHRVDDERYDEAAAILDQVIAVDPGEPRAWAYRAVLAHLKHDGPGEESARRSALARWAGNPEVDHVIGRELSRKYRFAEGSAYQKKALESDPNHEPSRSQLCQDLLRLGDEEAGWKLAADLFSSDAYNVLAFNLVTLRDRLAGFKTLKAEGLVVRMDVREAELYGPRVLALLTRARKSLGDKYGVEMKAPVTVEIFPRKNEFAVRTFGLPGAEGFLGVCFGRVITANSPASQGETPSNWEAVLWHEFCHAVTLEKTRNKMPRWLSEGISVYEEEKENPAWGGSLDPRYRAMILGDDFTPLSRLSSAFLDPKSPVHLRFAYEESALAVDFLVRKAGLDALKGLLDDLAAGMSVEESLPRRARTTLTQLDADFTTFARGKALAIAPEATWEEVELPAEANSTAVEAWLKEHPRSFRGIQRLAVKLVAEEKWPRAREVIEQFRKLDPEYVGGENAYMLIAAVHRRANEPAAERSALDEWARRDGSAGPAIARMMELDELAGDWKALAVDARRMLAINPLIADPHRRLARAAEKLGDRDESISAYRALATLDVGDPAEVHYRLARLLKEGGKPDEARREVLKALEEAPRFLDAHRLLLELAGPSRAPDPKVPPS